MITSDCHCGGIINFTPTRAIEPPKDVQHRDADGRQAPCPLK